MILVRGGETEINASGEMFNANINVDVNLGWKIVTNSQVELRQDIQQILTPCPYQLILFVFD
jgi:hypothetical protein